MKHNYFRETLITENYQRLPRFLLQTVGMAYQGIVSARNWAYDVSLLSSKRSSLPVICAGNVTAGGSGKSPFCSFLAEELVHRGFKPVILSRGYGGSLAGPHLVSPNDGVASVGDEALMQRLLLSPEIKLVIAKDRFSGANYITEQKLGNVIILDDGFQHRKLARDFNLLLLDASSTASVERWLHGQIIPVGLLREPLEQGLKRTSYAILVRKEVGEDLNQAVEEELEERISPVPHLTFHLAPSHFIDAFTNERFSLQALPSNKACAITAIADAGQFFSMVRSLGVKLTGTSAYPDHYVFKEEDLTKIACDDFPVISTAKDLVKLKSFVTGPGQLYILLLKGSFRDTAKAERFWAELIRTAR